MRRSNASIHIISTSYFLKNLGLKVWAYKNGANPIELAPLYHIL
ncbi:protein of unknown function [Shewanella benthica]|uniref:Uncharacterized protein n=1 Tax=Shewanella benthica TaxID=43661 RepID=A0A330M8U0_9GAMM|nr:protein of unknown function [Shewanella benthica]